MVGEGNRSGSGASIKRLGVLGTLVWDRIVSPAGTVEVEDWGGIGYSFAALEAALPEEWEVVPILKVGQDLADQALEYLAQFRCVMDLGSVEVVPEANNRVELRKEGNGRRTEYLSGGVPGWRWTEVAPQLEGLDALYVNFISGFEMSLECAEHLPKGFSGVVHADLHSLFLGIEGDSGRRTPRRLPEGVRWARCFDSVQMNEEEFGLFGGVTDEDWGWARDFVGGAPKMLLITLGPEGAVGVESDWAQEPIGAWYASRTREAKAPGRVERAPSKNLHVQGDAIGCGDVWGATFFGSFLATGELLGSMVRANEMAMRNLMTQGARALTRGVRRSRSSAEDATPEGPAK